MVREKSRNFEDGNSAPTLLFIVLIENIIATRAKGGLLYIRALEIRIAFSKT